MSNREGQLADLWAQLSTDAADARLLLRQAMEDLDPHLHDGIEPGLNKPATCQRIAELLISRGHDTPALGEALLKLRDGQKQFIHGVFPSLSAPQGTAAPAPLQLKRWEEPRFPLDRPWPGLGHCKHPAQLGGREVELNELCGWVNSAQQPILLLYAASGVGKSSLLDAGLRARLAKAGRAVALDRSPANPGLLGRLAKQLVTAPPALHDDDVGGFFTLLGAVGALAGQPPVLILDQAEDLLRDDAGKARLGPLLAAAAASEAAQWVLAYRHEHHAAMLNLLGEPLAYVEPRPVVAAGGIPRDRYHVLALRPLGRRQGSRFDENIVIKAFADAALGAPDSPLRRGAATVGLSAAAAERLGAAFARARKAEGGDALPLTPELQVVLDALRAEAVEAGAAQLAVPKAKDAVNALVEGALEKHLIKHLSELTLAQGARAAEARTAGLLLLSALTDGAGRRCAVERGALLSARGPLAARLCAGLAEPGRWLIVEAADVGGAVWLSLPHDSLARAIFDLIRDPAKAATYGLSAPLLDLERVVRSRVAVADTDPDAHHLSAGQVEQIEQQQDILVVGDRARAWWARVQQHRREEARRELVRAVRHEEPRLGAPLRALRRLQLEHGLNGAALVEVLTLRTDFDEERRDAIFGEGASALSDEEQVEQLPPLLASVAPAVPGQESEDNLWGALLAAADAIPPGPAQDAAIAVVVEALVARKGPPPAIREEDWSPVIAGEFQVGRFPEEEGSQSDEQLHTVALSPYRIAKVAVTFTGWWAFRVGGQGGDPAWYAPLPVMNVSWYEARGYAAWRGCRLPTERQFEAACRGGRADAYARGPHWAGGAEALQKWALHAENRERLGFKQRPMDAAQPIAGSPAHPLGLVHIQGNMYTWTMDWHTHDYAAANAQDAVQHAVPDPTTPPGRVLRGGSWSLTSSNARAARRLGNRPGNRNTDVGLRLVLPQPAGAGT